MRVIRRVLLIFALVIIVIVVTGWLGLRAYLSSSGARELAAGRLSNVFGLPVEVDDLNVGFGSSSLTFRVVQPAAEGRPAAEVLRVDSATADVSLADLAGGTARPTALTIRGLALTLHFDRDGKLLTNLPESRGEGEVTVPAIKAEDVSLTIKQDGRPEFQLSNAGLDVTPEDKALSIRGLIADPKWGQWKVTGKFDLKTGHGTLELKTDTAVLDLDLLRSIPFAPEETWAHVQPSGSTAARVSLSIGEKQKLGYDVALQPSGSARLGLPDLDAAIGEVAGTIRIHNSQVELSDCTGTLSDGALRVSGTLDFEPEPASFRFKVAAKGVDVRKLPAEWNVPKEFGGKLRGKADLELRVHDDGRIDPRGGGAAVLDDATFLGEPAEVELRLRGDGKRYRFDTTQPPAKSSSKSSHVELRKLTTFTVGAFHRTAAQNKTKTGDAEPTTLDATVRLRDVNLAELLMRLELSIPYKLGGKVTVEATVTIPVAQADNLKTYRVVGRVTSPSAQFENLEVRDFSARMEYANGVLKLTELRGSLPSSPGATLGSIAGTATAAIEPRGDVIASLVLTQVPLQEAVKAIPGGGIDLRGLVTGRAEFRAPLEKLSDPSVWVGSADLTADDLGVFGRAVRKATARVRVDRGTAMLTDTHAVIEGLPIKADGSIELSRPFQFKGNLSTTSLEAADIGKLLTGASIPFELQGKIQTAAKVTGAISPFTLSAGGTLKATDLKVGTNEGNSLEAKWQLDQDRVKVNDLSATLFGGSVTGSADVPLDATKSGRFSLTFTNLDAGPATKAVPDFPVRLTGRVSGKFAAELPAAKPGHARAVAADLDLTAPKLTVQGIPAERLAGKVSIAGGVADYSLEGRALGGSFDVKGRYPSRPKVEPPRPDGDGRGVLRVRGMDLQQLARVFKVEVLRPLRGRVDMTLNYDDDLVDGAGRIAISSLAWGDDSVASDLVGALRVRDGTLTLSDFGGSFAGGTLRGRARLNMEDPARNFFLITIDRADATRLFAPATGLSDVAAGEVSLSLRGRLGPETRGSGQIAFDQGSLFGLDASDLRVPFDWAFSTTGSGRVTVRDAAAYVGHGRLVGELTYDWGVTGRLSGQLRFSEVRLRRVFAGLGQTNLFGNGRFSGRFDFGGSDIRSIDDVAGTLTGTLNQATVQELPILRQLTPYLSPVGAMTPFQAGEVRGRLASGVFRLDRLALANASAKVFADGTITLAGRLDLDVIAYTGRVGVDDRLLRLFGLRLPVFGPIPLSLIRDVSDFLSNRTVQLEVSGTTRQPVVRVNTAALLSEEAVRFFVARYLPGIETVQEFRR